MGTTVTRTAAAAARYLSAEVQEIALHRGGCHCGDVRFEVEAASNPNPETKPSRDPNLNPNLNPKPDTNPSPNPHPIRWRRPRTWSYGTATAATAACGEHALVHWRILHLPHLLHPTSHILPLASYRRNVHFVVPDDKLHIVSEAGASALAEYRFGRY